MSNDVEKQKLRLPYVISSLVAIGSLCFAIGVWKNSNDEQWRTQLRLNDQLLTWKESMTVQVNSLKEHVSTIEGKLAGVPQIDNQKIR